MGIVLSGTSNDILINGSSVATDAEVSSAVTANNITYVDAQIATRNRLVQGTVVNSTSGTFIDFTGIPSWTKKITVMFNGVSTNGSSVVQVQLGSTTIQTTGYLGNADNGSGSGVSFTTGLGLERTVDATAIRTGISTFINLTSNTWVGNYVGTSFSTNMALSATRVTLSGVLDRIRITTVNGTDTFDAGQINIMYEG